MWAFGLHQFGRLLWSVAGALLLAAAVAALPPPDHGANGIGAYLSAWTLHLGGFVQFDFGRSAVFARPAVSELALRLPASFELFGVGAMLAFVLGVPLGLLSALGKHPRPAALLAQCVASLPLFCAALSSLWLADHGLHWQADGPLGIAIKPSWHGLVLQVMLVGIAGAFPVQRALRRAVASIADAPWRHGLRMMGLGGVEIMLCYVVPCILAGLFAALGDVMLVLLSAAAVTERVFDRPGAVALFVHALALADWSMAALALFVFVLLKLLVDGLGTMTAQALAPGWRGA